MYFKYPFVQTRISSGSQIFLLLGEHTASFAYFESDREGGERIALGEDGVRLDPAQTGS